VHRTAVLESLAPEERAVAEQVLQGGVPAVRRAVQEQNTKARAEGRPEVKADPLIALAEELLPRLKAAEWRDRAEAAVKDVDELNLRDLRSIIAGADASARDDESRILAKTLREALERREAAERDAWLKDITTCLDEGRVTRALRVAGRPPDPRTRFPSELMTRLTESASAAMCPEATPDRWAALLAALLESPVRRAVKPVGLPPEPGEPLLAAARQASGRVPALAAMLGLRMPPPPGPPRPGARPAGPGARPPAGAPRPGGGGPAVRPPSKPAGSPVETAAVEAAPVETPVEAAPVETATVETATVETPVEAAPVETATVETATVETATVETPVETATVETPVETATVETAPVETPIEAAPGATHGSTDEPDGAQPVERGAGDHSAGDDPAGDRTDDDERMPTGEAAVAHVGPSSDPADPDPSEPA